MANGSQAAVAAPAAGWRIAVMSAFDTLISVLNAAAAEAKDLDETMEALCRSARCLYRRKIAYVPAALVYDASYFE